MENIRKVLGFIAIVSLILTAQFVYMLSCPIEDKAYCVEKAVEAVIIFFIALTVRTYLKSDFRYSTDEEDRTSNLKVFLILTFVSIGIRIFI